MSEQTGTKRIESVDYQFSLSPNVASQLHSVKQIPWRNSRPRQSNFAILWGIRKELERVEAVWYSGVADVQLWKNNSRVMWISGERDDPHGLGYSHGGAIRATSRGGENGLEDFWVVLRSTKVYLLRKYSLQWNRFGQRCYENLSIIFKWARSPCLIWAGKECIGYSAVKRTRRRSLVTYSRPRGEKAQKLAISRRRSSKGMYYLSDMLT